MRIGYVRVSSNTQNPERQEVLMERLGVERVYMDICSGKDANRPQLMAMMDYVREGDTIVVESISRLARNVKDLLALTDEMIEKGVDFVSLKETIDTNTPAGKAMLTIFGAISQLERDYIRERQQEGIALRKARQGYQGRPPIQVPEADFKAVYDAWRAGEMTARQAMMKLGLKSNTFYRRVKKYEAKAHEESREAVDNARGT